MERGETLTDVPDPIPEEGYEIEWDRKDFSNVLEDITVYSVKTAKTFTATYELNGGVLNERSGQFTYDAYYELPKPRYDGYAFQGWIDRETQTRIESFGVWKISKNIDLVATWGEPKEIDELVDFVVEVESGRDIRVLQLTDTQIIDPSQSRFADRIGSTAPLTDEELYQKCFRYIEEAIRLSQPDLILLTGDIIYGEFDDNGENLVKLVEYMESFQIPWAPVFGNHDNESIKGVAWQCRQFIEAEHCLFKRGDITGNGNYTIGLVQDAILKKVVYMLDSNGCSRAFEYRGYTADSPEKQNYNRGERVQTEIGFGDDQIKWISGVNEEVINNLEYSVSSMFAFHIGIAEFSTAAYAAGYQSDDTPSNAEIYAIGEDVAEKNGDFGYHGEGYYGFSVDGFWRVLKRAKCDGVFVGHCHRINTSVLYDGIRLTVGLKTGEFDDHIPTQLGGTLICVKTANAALQVEHVYVRFGE